MIQTILSVSLLVRIMEVELRNICDPNDLVSLLIQINGGYSWIILKYERNICMYALYMNASIVFISWKVEPRVKESNTINNIDNNVIKKILTMMSI